MDKWQIARVLDEIASYVELSESNNRFKAAAYVYGMALVVGLYPAWRVTRMRPADALRRA